MSWLDHSYGGVYQGCMHHLFSMWSIGGAMVRWSRLVVTMNMHGSLRYGMSNQRRRYAAVEQWQVMQNHVKIGNIVREEDLFVTNWYVATC